MINKTIKKTTNLTTKSFILHTDQTLRLMVWNICKQRKANCLPTLKQYASQAQLLLLQEATATPELMNFAIQHHLTTNQVATFPFSQHASGVMTLANSPPLLCYSFKKKEPLIRLAKSSLVTVYPLLNEQKLMVINIHAINFSIGIEGYKSQLKPIGKIMTEHHGPVIMAGDFNAWSDQRTKTLANFITSMSLKEVYFTDDYRRTTFGYPLDFIFYRQLKVNTADILQTKSSDHNPLLVEFSATIP